MSACVIIALIPKGSTDPSAMRSFVFEDDYSTDSARSSRVRRFTDKIDSNSYEILCATHADYSHCAECAFSGAVCGKCIVCGKLSQCDEPAQYFKRYAKKYNPKSRSFYTVSDYDINGMKEFYVW